MMRAPVTSGWTLETYAAHNEALRASEERFHAERDRRYAEVKNAEEKALRVKEQADRDALALAREIQTYKDEKANELREQINSERGHYASKDDLAQLADKMTTMFAPVNEFIARNQGRGAGMAQFYGWIVGGIAVALALLNYFGKH